MASITGTDNEVYLPQREAVKISLNTESLTTLLRSNISCHMNKILTQELMEQLTAQIVESIDFFLNSAVD